MNIFPEDVMEVADKLGSDWIKGSEFESGLTLQIKSVEKVSSRYGAIETDSMVEKNILAVGEIFRYSFVTKDGKERKMDSKSMPMFIGFKSAGLEMDDWVSITRTGKGEETRYTVTKTSTEDTTAPQTPSTNEINPSDIPFN